MTEKQLVLDWDPNWKTDCAAQHLGMWLIEPLWFREALAAVRDGVWSARANRDRDNEEEPERSYQVDGTGLALIGIDGQMMKGSSKFGGVNTLQVRRALRMAAKDPEVNGIMLAIDSPGGTVSGTQELAADVAAAAKLKPLYAHIDDFGASAAYWVASQARRITAGPTAQVGSIGVLAVIEDSSQAMEKKGVVIHVISTGPFKGAGTAGAKVTDDHLAYFQARADALQIHFIDAVSQGRKAPLAVVQDWASGKVWIADQAKQMGLIDAVSKMDEAVSFARKEIADVLASAPALAPLKASVEETPQEHAEDPTPPASQSALPPATTEAPSRAQRIKNAIRRAEISRRSGR